MCKVWVMLKIGLNCRAFHLTLNMNLQSSRVNLVIDSLKSLFSSADGHVVEKGEMVEKGHMVDNGQMVEKGQMVDNGQMVKNGQMVEKVQMEVPPCQ